MPKGNKKERHRAKREAKRREARRRESVSPVKRLADSVGETECWMSKDFDGMGQAQIFIYKSAGAISGAACFLVDRGVVGLKDAWTLINLTRTEFKDMLDASARHDIPMYRTPLEDARRMVAGGIRWAHENGMRLPKDWAKPASLLGGVEGWMSADVSAFVKEFAGHENDLRQRLIHEPFETYIQRTDIRFEFSEFAPYMDQNTGEYVRTNGEMDWDDDDPDGGSAFGDLTEEEVAAFAERFTSIAGKLAEDTVKWLAARQEPASPELAEAWRTVIVASMLSKAVLPDASEEEEADIGFNMIQELAGRIEPSRVAEYQEAIDQVLEHLETDNLMMQKAVLKYGLPGASDDAGEPPDETGTASDPNFL